MFSIKNNGKQACDWKFWVFNLTPSNQVSVYLLPFSFRGSSLARALCPCPQSVVELQGFCCNGAAVQRGRERRAWLRVMSEALAQAHPGHLFPQQQGCKSVRQREEGDWDANGARLAHFTILNVPIWTLTLCEDNGSFLGNLGFFVG